MKIDKLIAIGLFILTICSACSQEEEPMAGATNRPFTLEVSDGGFLSAESKSGNTRAAEAGYQTVFTDGDRIGLIVVDASGSVITNNQPFTYNGTAWANDQGSSTVAYNANYRYLFYYPYSTAMNGKASLDEVKAAFAPKADQSNYADYTASDLMVGEGSFNTGKGVLKVALQHAMTLLVLDVTEKYLCLDGTTLSWTSLHLAHGGFTINDEIYVPHHDGGRKIRLLLPPSFSGGEVQFFYTFRDQRKAGQATLSAGSAGSYQRINRTYAYTPSLWDIYYSDGVALPLEAGYWKKPIGIVYWLGDITGDDPLLKKKFPGGTKGLAVALHDAGDNSKWSSGYEDVTQNWLSKLNDNPYGITSLKTDNKMQGYANTKALEGYNASSRVIDNPGLKVLPIDKIKDYALAYPAPAGSSGWYWPSVMELKYICWGQGNGESIVGTEMLNELLSNVSGSSLQSSYYWSSTENDGNWAWYVNFDRGYVDFGDKDYDSVGVRAVVAF